MPFDLAASTARRAASAAAVQQLAASPQTPADFRAAREIIAQNRAEHAAACEAQRGNLSRLQQTR